ncbi:MAG: alkaline phosphatase family protein [Myxococcales bacterium]|nr:MAG: alkaline phosphatase family protein [Myxococcales bacterium]
MIPPRRVMIVGIDCAAPKLVFDRFKDHLPNLTRMRKRGMWGPLRSTIPPITVPAWMSMASGYDPGALGLYGFRKHEAGSYDLKLHDSSDMHLPCLWERLSAQGKKAASLFVPLSYPPKPFNGWSVTGCLTPDTECNYTWPQDFKQEFETHFGPYLIDAAEHRQDDRATLFESLCNMSKQRFAAARYLWSKRQLDFLMMVDIGMDRMHHAFWKHADPNHPEHDPSDPNINIVRDYYAYLDSEIGQLLSLCDENTSVFVVSDHGARSLLGGVNINEWLIEHGFLKLKHRPSSVSALHPEMVDWKSTSAWAEGGYYARLFINLQGREAQGCVPAENYEALRNSLMDKLSSIDIAGKQAIAAKALRAQDCYAKVARAAAGLDGVFRRSQLPSHW